MNRKSAGRISERTRCRCKYVPDLQNKRVGGKGKEVRGTEAEEREAKRWHRTLHIRAGSPHTNTQTHAHAHARARRGGFRSEYVLGKVCMNRRV